MRIKFPTFGGLGDELCVTPSVRVLRKTDPEERIALVGFRSPEIWWHNPYLPGGNVESGRIITLDFSTHWNSATHVAKWSKQITKIDLGQEPPEIYLTEAELREGFGIRDWKRTLAVDVWSSAQARRWPFPYFEEAARMLRRTGWQVIEVGSHKGPRLSDVISFRERTTVRETAAIIRRCTLYWGNDSGLLHLAAAVGTPQVAVFSVTPLSHVGYRNTTGLESPIVCGGWLGCGHTCNQLGPYPRCLSDIGPAQVVEAIEKVALGRPGQ